MHLFTDFQNHPASITKIKHKTNPGKLSPTIILPCVAFRIYFSGGLAARVGNPLPNFDVTSHLRKVESSIQPK